MLFLCTSSSKHALWHPTNYVIYTSTARVLGAQMGRISSWFANIHTHTWVGVGGVSVLLFVTVYLSLTWQSCTVKVCTHMMTGVCVCVCGNNGVEAYHLAYLTNFNTTHT